MSKEEAPPQKEYFKVTPTLNPQIVTFDKLSNLVTQQFTPTKATGLHKTDIKQMIAQYLDEHGYSTTLQAFQNESYTKYDPDLLKMGGQLENIIQEYGDLQELTELENKATKLSINPETQKAQDELLKEGDKTFINQCLSTFSQIHSANILSVNWSYHPVSMLATGSSDKTVKIWNLQGELVDTFKPHEGATISLDFNPNKALLDLLLTSSMDKTFALIDIGEKKVLNNWKNHQKFVVAIRWNTSGNLFATASHDHTVCIFGNTDVQPKEFQLQKQLTFNANPESLAFRPESKTLVIAIRESNNLRLVNTETFEIEKFNMNANLDDHVSFSALNLNFSRDGKYILVSADNSRLLLYRLGDSTPLRVFYGATNDIYSQPRNAWHPSGKYVYSNSQDHKIFVWSVHDAKIVCKLEGHTSNVRDIAHHPTKNILASISFDKSLRLWHREE